MPTSSFQSSVCFSKKTFTILNTPSPLHVVESGSENKYCTFTLFSEI